MTLYLPSGAQSDPDHRYRHILHLSASQAVPQPGDSCTALCGKQWTISETDVRVDRDAMGNVVGAHGPGIGDADCPVCLFHAKAPQPR